MRRSEFLPRASDRAVGDRGHGASVAIIDGMDMQPTDMGGGRVGGEEQEQLTRADILKAVNKCTASVDTLKEQFRGLKETVALIR